MALRGHTAAQNWQPVHSRTCPVSFSTLLTGHHPQTPLYIGMRQSASFVNQAVHPIEVDVLLELSIQIRKIFGATLRKTVFFHQVTQFVSVTSNSDDERRVHDNRYDCTMESIGYYTFCVFYVVN
jgi:hypothetical protein